MIKVEDHHYTKHLSQFLFPFWSHELLLLWLLEFIAELLKPEMNFAQICLNFSFNFNTFAFEEPASVFPSSGSPPAPPSSRSSLRIPEKDWMQSSISKDFDSLLRIHLLERVGWSPWYQRQRGIPILNWIWEFSWKVGNSPKIWERSSDRCPGLRFVSRRYVLWFRKQSRSVCSDVCTKSVQSTVLYWTVPRRVNITKNTIANTDVRWFSSIVVMYPNSECF